MKETPQERIMVFWVDRTVSVIARARRPTSRRSALHPPLPPLAPLQIQFSTRTQELSATLTNPLEDCAELSWDIISNTGLLRTLSAT